MRGKITVLVLILITIIVLVFGYFLLVYVMDKFNVDGTPWFQTINLYLPQLQVDFSHHLN